MDVYGGPREAPSASARSPPERTSWGVREDAPRPGDRANRPDTFYRGRSPGMFQTYFFYSRTCSIGDTLGLEVSPFLIRLSKPFSGVDFTPNVSISSIKYIATTRRVGVDLMK